MKKKIKIGLVGCGRISKQHFESILSYTKMYELVSICDNNSELLEISKQKYKVNAYSNMKDMIANELIDLVILCTPSGFHAKQAILAANNGINILTEKPMAIKLSDGQEMVRICKKNGVKLAVIKQNRLIENIRLLKKNIVDGHFGNLIIVNVNVFWQRPQTYYDEAKWRGTLDLDGGAFMNQASHFVDLLFWLFGDIESINAMLSTKRSIQTEDTGVLNIKWCSGLIGSMNVTMLTYPKNFESSITVIGENGTMKISGSKFENIEHTEFKNIQLDLNQQYNQSKIVSGHAEYYKNLYEHLINNSNDIVTGEEGLKSLEILNAIYLSQKKNQIIKLPLDESI